MGIRIATRGSKLAIWQAEYVKQSLLKIDPSRDIHIKIIKTTGDKILDKPLAEIGGKGLFIKEIEEALLNNEADIAVHSLKDFSVDYDEKRFALAAVTRRTDRRDAFVSEHYETLVNLPQNAVVGTGSIRRAMQLKKFRNDLIIKDLRGNINTRIAKLKEGDFDAIILAKIGIKRLELYNELAHVEPIDTNIMIPAAGQGALAVETLKDSELIELVSKLNDKTTAVETAIERDFVRKLNLGCHAPVGVSAHLTSDYQIDLKAILMTEENQLLKKEIVVDFGEHENIGNEFAKAFI